MDWERVWPIIISTPGGVFMAVALWAIVTNRIALPREVLVWKDLYDKAVLRNEKLEDMVAGMTTDLRKQGESHTSTIEMLREIMFEMRGKQGSTNVSTPRRRTDDLPASQNP